MMIEKNKQTAKQLEAIKTKQFSQTKGKQVATPAAHADYDSAMTQMKFGKQAVSDKTTVTETLFKISNTYQLQALK